MSKINMAKEILMESRQKALLIKYDFHQITN